MNSPALSAAATGDAYESLVQFLYQAPIGLVQTDADGCIEMINPMGANLLMTLSTDGSLDNLFDVLDPVAPQLRALTAAFEDHSGVVCQEQRVMCKLRGPRGEGPRMDPVLSVSLLKLDGARLMATLSNVTLEVQREQQGLGLRLRAAARTDSLTQLPNRAALSDEVSHAMARAAGDSDYRYAVLFINCDRFKQVNDALGNAVGDAVLVMMAQRMRTALRLGNRIDSTVAEPLAARIGGDEFAVVLHDLPTSDDALVVAQRLLTVLSGPYGTASGPVRCAVSVGLVLHDQAEGDANSVLRDASTAMVEAKRSGGACCRVFEPALRERASQRSGIEADLHRALTEGEFFVVYQPVVGLLVSGGVDCSVGVEALVRWQHPTRGLVPPIHFIGVAEDCGLIGAIGEFVMRTACRQFMVWKHTLGGRAPRGLAVNVSRAQLVQEGCVASVRDALQSCGMDAAALQLEVTESLAAQDEAVQARLHALKALGLTLALDDFGTGYSSLSSLHQLPVDVVKIDRSFVAQSDTSHFHRVLIEATVQVARCLGMGTVAEGIETEAQEAVVRQLGCDKAQGYLHARPMVADEVARWLTARTPHAPV